MRSLSWSDPVRWATVLLLAVVLLQRFSVPGMPVSILLPVVLLWALAGFCLGVLEFDSWRTVGWLLAPGGTALVFVPQMLWVSTPSVSYTSWALIAATWLPATLRFVDRSSETFGRALDALVRVSTWLAVVSILFIVVQFAGWQYRDVFADVVPEWLQLQGYVGTYGVTWDSAIMKSNAWVCLEPSFVSVQLGAGVVAAMVRGVSIRRMMILVSGLVSAVSGSGFAIVAVGAVALFFSGHRKNLLPYVLPMVGVICLSAATPMGQSILSRLTEFNDAESSTSARALEPYRILLPDWAADKAAVLMGMGAGSSQRVVDASGFDGLLVPTGLKITYDYGLLGGALLAGFLMLCYVRVPSHVITVSLVLSMWTLQPGLTATPFVIIVLIVGTWWAPRTMPEVIVPESLFRDRKPILRRTNNYRGRHSATRG